MKLSVKFIHYLNVAMGQYYKIIFLAEKKDGSKEIIRAWIDPNCFKLMEHSYLDNEFLHLIEFLLSCHGMFYCSRLVWAGDYADPEERKEKRVMTREEAFAVLNGSNTVDDEPSPNLYELCKEDGTSLQYMWRGIIHTRQLVRKTLYSYVVNHTKRQFVMIRKDGKHVEGIHPLPLLVSEGNGSGGGDYFGHNQDLCGTWARDIISVEDSIPEDYKELVCDFAESSASLAI